MMQSIASIQHKSSPPPPSSHRRHANHPNTHRHKLAIQKDINPATYYDHLSRISPPGTPRGSITIHPQHVHTSSPRQDITTSSSLNNLFSHSKSNLHNTTNPTKSKNIRSQSNLDLFSYTDANINLNAQQNCFTLMDNLIMNPSEYNEYNEYNNPNNSWTDLYEIMKTKTKTNKKQYKNTKVKNNISNYMTYMSHMNDHADDEYSGDNDDQEGKDTLYIESSPEVSHNNTNQLELPLQLDTTFDSVNDIFNLIPNNNNNNNNNNNMKCTQSVETSTININLNDIKEDEMSARSTVYDYENPSDEGIGNVNETNDGNFNDENNKRYYERLKQILDGHDMANLSSDGCNSDAVFTKIDSLCQDLNIKKSKVKDIENKYNNLETFLSELKSENELLKRKNNELSNKLNNNELRNNVTSDNVLYQLYDYLNELKFEIINNKNNTNFTNKIVFSNFKIKLESTYESLIDLANDLNCQLLQSTVNKVNKSINDIKFLQEHKLFRISNLEKIINDLLNDLNINNTIMTTNGNINEDNERKYPEFIYENGEKNDEFLPVIKKDCKGNGNGNGAFDDEFPIVLRIDIYGGWFNKKSKAIIKYKNKMFYRKDADFKWLYKMIKVNNNENKNKNMPELPKELPQVLWPNNYLTKRKNELNLFLMQCHSVNNIKNNKPWNIFLENNKKNWKEKRDKYDKIMLKKIKENTD